MPKLNTTKYLAALTLGAGSVVCFGASASPQVDAAIVWIAQECIPALETGDAPDMSLFPRTNDDNLRHLSAVTTMMSLRTVDTITYEVSQDPVAFIAVTQNGLGAAESGCLLSFIAPSTDQVARHWQTIVEEAALNHRLAEHPIDPDAYAFAAIGARPISGDSCAVATFTAVPVPTLDQGDLLLTTVAVTRIDQPSLPTCNVNLQE